MDVTLRPDAVTLFSAPLPNIGLLAHDYLAGKLFYELEIGNTVEVNGQAYQVSKIRIFTWDAEHAWLYDQKGNKWAEWEVYQRIYSHPLVLQTCTRNGFYFVLGEEIEENFTAPQPQLNSGVKIFIPLDKHHRVSQSGLSTRRTE